MINILKKYWPFILFAIFVYVFLSHQIVVSERSYGEYLNAEQNRQMVIKKAKRERAKIMRRYEKKLQAIEENDRKLIKEIEKKKEQAEKEALEYKSSLKKKTDDGLLKEAQKYYAGFSLIQAGLFQVDRPGMEFTLGIFRDKEKFEKQYSEEQKKSEKLFSDLELLKIQSKHTIDKIYESWQTELDSISQALLACQKALKQARQNRWWNIGKGAVGGFIFGWLLGK